MHRSGWFFFLRYIERTLVLHLGPSWELEIPRVRFVFMKRGIQGRGELRILYDTILNPSNRNGNVESHPYAQEFRNFCMCFEPIDQVST